ncbi:MAG: hypothetical protein NTX25_03535, partial [Proteobacteria bacterium]|nr:hypothetical protein [Pseudomonadota bacterium]
MNKLHSKNPRLVHEDLAWELVDTVDESKRISGVELNLKAYAAQRQHDGFVVTGSWAGTSKQALDIAYFELLERIALMEVFDGPRDRTLFGRSVHSG